MKHTDGSTVYHRMMEKGVMSHYSYLYNVIRSRWGKKECKMLNI